MQNLVTIGKGFRGGGEVKFRLYLLTLIVVLMISHTTMRVCDPDHDRQLE